MNSSTVAIDTLINIATIEATNHVLNKFHDLSPNAINAPKAGPKNHIKDEYKAIRPMPFMKSLKLKSNIETSKYIPPKKKYPEKARKTPKNKAALESNGSSLFSVLFIF